MMNIKIMEVPFTDKESNNKTYALVQISLNLENEDNRIKDANLDIADEDMENNDYNNNVMADVQYYIKDNKIDKNIELYYLNGYTTRQFFNLATEEEYNIIEKYIIDNKKDILKLLKANKS